MEWLDQRRTRCTVIQLLCSKKDRNHNGLVFCSQKGGLVYEFLYFYIFSNLFFAYYAWQVSFFELTEPTNTANCFQDVNPFKKQANNMMLRRLAG